MCTSQKKDRRCEVLFKKVHEMNWGKLTDYLSGAEDSYPSDVVQVMDIILKSNIAQQSA